MLESVKTLEELVPAGQPWSTRTRDLRVESIRALIPPAQLLGDLPLTEAGAQAVGLAYLAHSPLFPRTLLPSHPRDRASPSSQSHNPPSPRLRDPGSQIVFAKAESEIPSVWQKAKLQQPDKDQRACIPARMALSVKPSLSTQVTPRAIVILQPILQSCHASQNAVRLVPLYPLCMDANAATPAHAFHLLYHFADSLALHPAAMPPPPAPQASASEPQVPQIFTTSPNRHPRLPGITQCPSLVFLQCFDLTFELRNFLCARHFSHTDTLVGLRVETTTFSEIHEEKCLDAKQIREILPYLIIETRSGSDSFPFCDGSIVRY